jgi:hypothetical protein
VYSGGPQRPAYTVNDLVRLLAVVDTSGKPVAALCSSVILTEYQAVSGRYYMPWTNGTPANATDWSLHIDSVLTPFGPLSRLDSAAAQVVRELGGKVSVAIMVPYPHPMAERGVLPDSDRVARVKGYLNEVTRRVQELSLKHVTVSAFYWLNEAVEDSDTAMVSRIADAVHDKGMRFLWIPYWEAHTATRWRALGFDEAWQQPNYFFHPEIATSRIDSAVQRARVAGMGLELEFDGRLFSDPRFADRLEPYLRAFEGNPDMRGKSITIYDGKGALIQLSQSRDAAHRALYRRLVAVLRTEQEHD